MTIWFRWRFRQIYMTRWFRWRVRQGKILKRRKGRGSAHRRIRLWWLGHGREGNRGGQEWRGRGLWWRQCMTRIFSDRIEQWKTWEWCSTFITKGFKVRPEGTQSFEEREKSRLQRPASSSKSSFIWKKRGFQVRLCLQNGDRDSQKVETDVRGRTY